jgi:hypothetical protein
MKYSTGRKGRSKLQGHRKRTKSPALTNEDSGEQISWTEYKAIRQYQTMGDILEIIMTFGFQGSGNDYSMMFLDNKHTTSNGYFWLTRDPP